MSLSSQTFALQPNGLKSISNGVGGLLRDNDLK